MKSKFVFGLLAIMVVLAIAPSSFAQINIQIFNSASPKEIKTNRTAETSDPLSAGAGITVSGAIIASSNLSTTNLILTFPATITSGVANPGTGVAGNTPTGDAIRIVAQTGVFANASIVTKTATTITISLIPADVNGNLLDGSFRILGTRIDANGLTAPASATATLSSSGNNFFLATTTIPLISATEVGIASLAQSVITGTNGGPITIFTNRTVVAPATTLVITEGFEFAWRSAVQNAIDAPGAAGVGATQIRLTLNGIPATTTVTAGTPSTNNGSVTVASATGAAFPINLSSTTNTLVLTFNGTRSASIDAVQIPLSITAGPTSTPTVGAMTATVTLFPLGDALNANGTLVTGVVQAGGATADPVVPRFVAAEVGPATFGNVIAASTTMLVPFVMKAGTYDTGLAISNTTADPFGATGGGATASAGSLTLDFFPRTATGAGTPWSFTTSATVRPGTGLSAVDGTLAAGGTWTALVSEMLTAAGQTGDFTGYVFIRTNFLNAHGVGTVSDFKTYSLATQVLVLTPPQTAAGNRNTPPGSVESLNQ